MNKLSKINPYIWFGLILLTALIIRTYHITYPIIDTHSFRQTQTAGLIRDFYRDGINLLYPRMITLGDPGYVILEFPLYQAISALLYKMFLPDVILARGLSIVCGLLSIVFVYRLSNKFLDQKTALFASFFYAFMPLNIFYQRVPIPDPLTILLSLVMLDFMIEGINNKKNIFLIGGILAGSFGLMMKSPYVAPLYLPLIYIVFKQNKNLRSLLNVRFLLSLFIPLALLVLWQRHANAVNETYFGTNSYPFRELFGAVIVKLKPLNKWYFGTLEQRSDLVNYLIILKRIYHEMLSFIGILALFFGFVYFFRRRAAAFYLIWLFAILLSIMVIFNLNVVHNYYQLPLTPILAIFCGAGAAYLVGFFRNRIIAVFAGAILLIPFIFVNYLNAQKLFKEENNLFEVGQFIDRSIEKNAMIATSLPKEDLWEPVLMCYSDRRGFNVSHKRLNEDMIGYLRVNNVKYLALVDYLGMDNVINKVICPYKVLNENDRVTIYDITRRFKVCKKEGLSSTKTASSVIEFNFENGIKGWQALGKSQIVQDKTKKHDGKASMKITGIGQAGLWSFAQSGKFNIYPGKRYRFSGWMFLDSISSDTSNFKCEFWQEGKWLRNIESYRYDLNKQKQWQELTAECVAPDEKGVSLSFTIEKRPMEKDIKATIYVDEIKLEMLY